MRRFHRLTVVALVALVATGCDGGSGIPDAGSSSSAASQPASPTVDVPNASTTPTPDPTPTVEPPSGVRVLAGPVRGAGPGLVATLQVPQRFAVVVACRGTGRFVIVVEGKGRGNLPARCGARSKDFLYQPLGEPGQVTVRIDTEPSVKWAVLITTSTH